MLRTVLILAGLLTGTSTQRASIRIPPSSVNVTLNGVALFNCTAIATFINWEANGEPTLRSEGFDDSVSVLLNETQSLRMATLRVAGSSNINNVSIVCVAILVSSTTKPVERSEAALLLVQGLLDAIDNLTVTALNFTTVIISWSPPFTLDGIPILGYDVTISSGLNETSMLVEDPTLLYIVKHPDIGSSLMVTVVPLNRAGKGKAASISIALPLLLSPATTQAAPGKESSLLKIISPHPILITSISMAVNAKAGLSDANVVVIAVVTPVTFTVAVIMFTTTCVLIAYTIRRQIIKTTTSATVQDVVVALDNPAYEVVKKRQIQLQENNAYSVVFYNNPTV